MLQCAVDNTHHSEEMKWDNNEFAQFNTLGNHEYNEVKKKALYFLGNLNFTSVVKTYFTL